MHQSIEIFDREIKSERLKLRKIRLSDLDDIFEYTSNPITTKFLFWKTHTNKKQTLKFINDTLNEYTESNSRYTWGITINDNKKLIGVASIFFISYLSKRVEISYILNPNYQGNGYMKEALTLIQDFIFNEVSFIRIQARCTEDNLASKKVMKSIGMELEGKLKKYWFLKNEYQNVDLFAITK